MPITQSKCGVWILDDTHKKIQSGYLRYEGSDQLWAWGCGGGTYEPSALGVGSRVHRSSPVQVPGTRWSAVAGGVIHTMALKTDSTLWNWGNSGSGQLANCGPGGGNYQESPIQVPGTAWNDIAISRGTSFARKTDGSLWSWGSGYRGALGTNCSSDTAIVRAIDGLTWCDISGGYFSSVGALKTDGTLWTWGNNYRGQLGINNTIHRSSPVQVPGTTWSSVSFGDCNTLGLKTDGTLWSWGYNGNGRLGTNNIIHRSSPVQVPGTTWNQVSTGSIGFSFARKTDGTLWSWGCNGNGQLGHDTTIHRSSPVQVPGTQWASVQGARIGGFAIKTDGTLWSWGSNGYGILGTSTSTAISRSSPVQIPGSWSEISSQGRFAMARKSL